MSEISCHWYGSSHPAPGSRGYGPCCICGRTPRETHIREYALRSSELDGFNPHFAFGHAECLDELAEVPEALSAPLIKRWHGEKNGEVLP